MALDHRHAGPHDRGQLKEADPCRDLIGGIGRPLLRARLDVLNWSDKHAVDLDRYAVSLPSLDLDGTRRRELPEALVDEPARVGSYNSDIAAGRRHRLGDSR